MSVVRRRCYSQTTLDGDVCYFDAGEAYCGEDDDEVRWRVSLRWVNWAFLDQDVSVGMDSLVKSPTRQSRAPAGIPNACS